MPSISLADLASPEVLARARKIKLFLMDVDGTLTDGGVCLISSTAADRSRAAVVSEMKVFNAKDGQGLSLAHTMGIQTGFITGRRSPAVAKRAEELKVTFVYLGQAKWPTWVTIYRIYRWRSAPVWQSLWPMVLMS
jgi:3-deoxy-D-manno-octulosonate 8-phosphate phosphatase (KDO 8-P phosphatase)